MAHYSNVYRNSTDRRTQVWLNVGIHFELLHISTDHVVIFKDVKYKGYSKK